MSSPGPAAPPPAPPLTGSCLCGQITYAVAAGAAPLHNVICHCGNCKKATGTHMFNSSVFLARDFAITSPAQPKCYTDANVRSGQALRRYFCGDCGSPIYCVSSSPQRQGVVSLTAGTVDRPGRGGSGNGSAAAGEGEGEEEEGGRGEWVPDMVVFGEGRPAFLEGIKVVEKEGVGLPA